MWVSRGHVHVGERAVGTYTCGCGFGSQRGQVAFPSALHLIPLGQNLSLNLALTIFWLCWQLESPSDPVSASSAGTGIKGMHGHAQFSSLQMCILLLEQQVCFFCLLGFCFGHKVSLCSPGCPGTNSVDQTQTEMPLSLPPEY